jgi:hypothetical protein
METNFAARPSVLWLGQTHRVEGSQDEAIRRGTTHGRTQQFQLVLRGYDGSMPAWIASGIAIGIDSFSLFFCSLSDFVEKLS